MIDVMALRQSFERREITEVRWIDGRDNPADAMTKRSPCKALTEIIATNKLIIRVDGWVERSPIVVFFKKKKKKNCQCGNSNIYQPN